jgi:hypothetical protein
MGTCLTHTCILFCAHRRGAGGAPDSLVESARWVEPDCRGGRSGLPLTIRSPGLPLYLPIYIYIYIYICGHLHKFDSYSNTIQVHRLVEYEWRDMWYGLDKIKKFLTFSRSRDHGHWGWRYWTIDNQTGCAYQANLRYDPFNSITA